MGNRHWAISRFVYSTPHTEGDVWEVVLGESGCDGPVLTRQVREGRNESQRMFNDIDNKPDAIENKLCFTTDGGPTNAMRIVASDLPACHLDEDEPGSVGESIPP